jgi:plastocyanin/sugar lactone lactonase YvrE
MFARTIGVAALLVGLAALGGGAGPGDAAQPGAPAAVTIQNFAFTPAALQVTRGTTVVWTQRDMVSHTVTSGTPGGAGAGAVFGSGNLSLGQTFSFTFMTAGSYAYFCSIHPYMTAAVQVTDSAPATPAPSATPTPPPTASPAPTATPSPTPAPAAVAPPGAELVAGGLVNPRGFDWGPDGALYVAESGQPPTRSGALPTGTGLLCEGWRAPDAGRPLPEGCPPREIGGNSIDYTGRISRIAPDGTRTTVIDNLPVTVGSFGDALGPNSLAFVGNDLYLILAGPDCGQGFAPSGVYRIGTDGSWTLIADLGAYNRANPPTFVAPDFCGSNPYDVVAVDGKLYIADGNVCVILEVDPAKPEGQNIRRLADLSVDHPVTTGIAIGPDHALYITNLTHAPYVVGTGQVWRVTLDGDVSDVGTGVTLGVGAAVGPDGTIYVSEFSRSTQQPPYIAPPGRVVRLERDGTVTPVLTPVNFPTVIRWGPDGLYATENSVGAGRGAIYRMRRP